MFSKLAFLFFAGFALADTGNMCGQEEGYSASGYRVQNNLWGKGSATSGSQCTGVKSISSSGAKWSTTWEWYGGNDNVKSYSYSAREGFSKRPVSQISSMSTSASWSMNNGAARCDVAYDIFTAADPNHSTDSGDYELMIWLGRYGDVYPIGSKKYSANLAGHTWEVWVGYNGAMKVFSYIAPSPVTSFSADVKAFFNHMTSVEAFPASSQNLITFQFGTEAFTGSKTTFDVSNWSANIN